MEACPRHEHCMHENLRLCEHCDVAYCVDCKKEWGVGSTYQPYTTIVTDPTIADTTTAIYIPACSHA